MFVIVAPNGKQDITSQECVCLSGIQSIQEIENKKTRLVFSTNTLYENALSKLSKSDIEFDLVWSAISPVKNTLDFKSELIIAIMP